MDREIKFRVWDKQRKIMGIVQYISWEENILSFLEMGTDKYFGYINSDDLILMQYTGLKDKNGTKIYEGDIVGEEHPESNHEPFDQIPNSIRGVVKFERGKFIVPAKVDYGVEKRNLHAVKGVAVVGNIYENPELLDKLNNIFKIKLRN